MWIAIYALSFACLVLVTLLAIQYDRANKLNRRIERFYETWSLEADKNWQLNPDYRDAMCGLDQEFPGTTVCAFLVGDSWNDYRRRHGREAQGVEVTW